MEKEHSEKSGGKVSTNKKKLTELQDIFLSITPPFFELKLLRPSIA